MFNREVFAMAVDRFRKHPVQTSLTLAGLDKIKLALLEKYESAIMGGLLCAVGLLILVFEH